MMLSSLEQWYFWNNLKCQRSKVSKRKPSELMIPARQNTVFQSLCRLQLMSTTIKRHVSS